ncbi:hypothetical protein Ahy_B09g096457 isoform B [Arachis hypogaea]|uniref:Aminotransferase-like plant mobile domain-containing protein n=1 Tax=Arachis hypogaea TaxID=3818 RepID=A0A444XKT8_ARAHY|nr:hypothetical protein Ahy_B09g096457 isoform B [Arachis hypogaea]
MILHDRIMPYLDSAGLLHVARLNDYWFKLDEPPISAFVEQWHPETHTFHMPFGECTVTLQDMAYQFGLPIDGFPVSGCLSDFEQLFRVMPTDATEPTVQVYARGYIMMLLSMMLFGDKSGARVHLRWLPYVADLDELGKYSWGSATLCWLYRCLCRVANRNVKNLAGTLALLQSWIFWRFPTFRPRGFDVILWPLASRALEVIQVVHPDILRPEHTHLWKSTTALIYFSSIEWHHVDRVLSQLGGVQHVSKPAINIDFLLSKDGQGPTHWFPEVFATWHECWDQRHQSVLTFQLVPDPRPSVEYLDWWYRVACRFLSHDRDLVDPRQAGIPADAPVRGHIVVPARQQGPNFA